MYNGYLIFLMSMRRNLNSGFYEKYKVDDAIEITMDEADELFYALEEAENLDALFKPLNDRDYRIKKFPETKSKRFLNEKHG